MTNLADMAHVTSQETHVWRECRGCGASAPMAPEVNRCARCDGEGGSVKPARRPRSDAGQVRLTERDVAVFRWLADMKAIYEDDLAALAAQVPGTPWTAAGRRPSLRRLQGMVGRWQRAGYADARRLVNGVPRIVRLTRAGAGLVGVDSFRETATVTAFHQCEVSRLRLVLEGRRSPSLGRLTAWESERAFRSDLDALGLARRGQAGREAVHVPDGVATYERGTRVAVEVERSAKSPARLARIVEELLTNYEVTLYAVAGNEVRNAVAAAERNARATLAHRQVSPDRIGALSIIDIPREVA
ncbi:hypothetical protein [Couchioplanes caeruleus]|uniref:Protein involved in plasmid replication-relaxation n=2 Tax=Couchioplanes caeruleus TaxID=56438 RepID=A0A1K0FK27_9ACTN|nr:hypothetical protein [Couchioplanes caeruleus]OJF13088.1 hypothetical protein BG844_17155 [Couchioplanes caeruleus subsp. caeruleus]ROP29519.1 hypothetical protein EDD30_2316 [Couchioplanes caeruleus]